MKSKGRRMLSNVVRGDFYDMDVLTDGGAVSIDSVVEGEDGEDDGFLVRIAPTSESGEDLSELEEKDEKGLLVRMEGPSLFTHNLATMWRLDAGRADPNDAIAGHLAVVSFDSLSLLLALDPPTDILLLGCGKQMAPISMIDAAIGRVDGGAAKFSERLWKHGIVVDPMSTVDACSTFNILR